MPRGGIQSLPFNRVRLLNRLRFSSISRIINFSNDESILNIEESLLRDSPDSLLLFRFCYFVERRLLEDTPVRDRKLLPLPLLLNRLHPALDRLFLQRLSPNKLRQQELHRQ
jgi:hypothetical protein